MAVARSLYRGSPYLGVHLKVSERAALLPLGASRELEEEVARLFGVPTVRTSVFDTEILGAMVVLNSNGAVVAGPLDPIERRALERAAPLSVVAARQNALGNNVLANDRGALVHPELPDEAIAGLSRALGVPARRGTLGGLGTVGMTGVATNRGVVVHPKTTPSELALAEQALGVPVHRSTANFGVPVVGACLVANSRAFLAGRPTTPVELTHLQEGLSIFD